MWKSSLKMFYFFSPEGSSWAVISATELSYSTNKQKKEGELKLELAIFHWISGQQAILWRQIQQKFHWRHHTVSGIQTRIGFLWVMKDWLENCNIDFTTEYPEQIFQGCYLNISNKTRIAFFSAQLLSAVFVIYNVYMKQSCLVFETWWPWIAFTSQS